MHLREFWKPRNESRVRCAPRAAGLLGGVTGQHRDCPCAPGRSHASPLNPDSSEVLPERPETHVKGHKRVPDGLGGEQGSIKVGKGQRGWFRPTVSTCRLQSGPAANPQPHGTLPEVGGERVFSP